MKRHFQLRSTGLAKATALALAAIMALSACSGGAAKPTEVKISAPVAGAALSVGQGTVIQGEAVGENIIRVEVIIDGMPYASLSTPDKTQGVPNFPVQVPWTPPAAGSHAIQMRAFGPEDKLLAQSEPLVIEAKAAVAQATVAPPTPTPVPTQAPPSGGQATSAPPAATSAPAATTAPANEAPSLTVTNEFVNVRTGPNTAYNLLGRLNQNQTAPVRGKSADGQWWQITYSGGPNGVGWVFGEYVQANSAATSVAVASAPPLPTSPPAPPAPVVPTSPPPTAPAPVQTLPTAGSPYGSLKVNQNPVPPGGSVTAFWNVQGIEGIWVDKGDGAGFVAAEGVQTIVVSGINAARTLQLKWRKGGVDQIDQLVVGVSGQAVPGPAVLPTVASSAWAPKFKAGSTNWSGNDTCTQADVNGSCTYYWADMAGASGIWIRVVSAPISECPAGTGGTDPGDAKDNWKPLAGPSGNITIKFTGTGGYVIQFRVAKDGKDPAYYDEKPMKVQPCNSAPAPAPNPNPEPTLTPEPLPDQ